MRVCPQNGQKLNGCVSTGLPAPEFVEDRDYLVVRFTRPVKTEGRLDDAELVLSMIRKDPEIRQMDIVEATGMSLSKAHSDVSEPSVFSRGFGSILLRTLEILSMHSAISCPSSVR